MLYNRRLRDVPVHVCDKGRSSEWIWDLSEVREA